MTSLPPKTQILSADLLKSRASASKVPQLKHSRQKMQFDDIMK